MIKRVILSVVILLVAGTAAAQLVEKPPLQLQDVTRALVRIFGGTVDRPLSERFADTLNAADFGAKPSNTDNTTAINAAVAALSAGATRGGCVVLNKGIFAVSGTITLPSGVSLCGSGNQIWEPGTRLNGTGASGQILIDIGNGSDNPHYNVVQDLAIDFANPQSAGVAVRVRNGVRITLQRLTFIKNYYDGIALSGDTTQPSTNSYDYRLSDIRMQNFTSTVRRGIWVGAPRNGNPSTVINLTLENITTSGIVDGVYLQNVGGVQGCAGCELAGGSRGLVIAPGDNETVDGVLWQGSFLDGNNLNGLAIVPTGSGGCVPYTSNTAPLCGRASQMSFINARPAFTLNGPGALLDSSGGGLVTGINFIGLESGLNAQEGLKVTGSRTKYINLVGSKISYNNTSNAGKAGVYIGAGVTNVTSNGGCVSTCSTQHPLTVNRQAYGFEIASGASNYIIQGMDLTNNVSGAISNTSTNLAWSLLNNLGTGESIVPGFLWFNKGDGSPRHGRIFDDGNFHVESTSGSLWLDAPVGANINIGSGAVSDVAIAYGGGNVGIGSGAPTAKLGVAGGVTASGAMRSNTGFNANGTAGVSATKTVRDAAGTGTCTLIFTFGLYTGGTC